MTVGLVIACARPARPQTAPVDGAVPDGNGRQAAPDVRDELSPALRKDIEQRLRENVEGLRAAGGLATVPAQPPAVLLSWPVAAPRLTDPGFYGISNYVDHDLIADGLGDHLLDYNCGTRTYDTAASYNHTGTDIFSWPYPWNKMDAEQVEAIAAAPGTIVDKEDGNYDRNCALNDLRPNRVIVQHRDGSLAWYLHLKRGSLTAKGIGDTVALGEYLGVVGSSGSSTGPHLHIEVYNSINQLNDPWMGRCNDFNAVSWWTGQQPYRVPTLLHLSTATAAPDAEGCGTPEITHEQSRFNPGNKIYFVVFFRDLLLNDTYLSTVRRPDNSIYSTGTVTNNEKDFSGAYVYQYFNSVSGPTGTWHWEVTFHTQTAIFAFDLGNGTSATPTPTPTVAPCTGDCNRDGVVNINEIVTMVNVALGLPISACSAGDADGSGNITVNEIVAAVGAALSGCASR